MSRPFPNPHQQFAQRARELHQQHQRGVGHLLSQRRRRQQMERLGKTGRIKGIRRSQPAGGSLQIPSLPDGNEEELDVAQPRSAGEKAGRVLGGALLGGVIGGLIFGPLGAAIGAAVGAGAAADSL